MEELKCIGCGATIQTENPKEIGYTPASSIAKMENEIIYCQRCFKLKHYNEVQDVSLTSDDLPEPDTPVTHVNTPKGIFTFKFFKLFSLAPIISIASLLGFLLFSGTLICFLLDKY